MVTTSSVLDSAMERVMKLDIKVDVLLGDFRSVLILVIMKKTISISCSYSDQTKQILKTFDYLHERKYHYRKCSLNYW
jgi:thiamine pyrophosphokinase